MRERSIRRCLTRCLLSVAIAVLFSFNLSAQDADIVLPLTLNSQPRGEVFARVAGDDILLRVSDLSAMGLSGKLWETLVELQRTRGPQSVDGEMLISLTGAAPYLTFHFDEANLEVAVIADPRLLKPTEKNLRGTRPEEIDYSRDSSFFLNYAASTRNLGSVSAFVETGASLRGNLLLNTLSRSPSGRVIRGVTNLTIDDRPNLRRWIAGDATVVTDALGGSALLGGVTVSKFYGLDPYFVRFPSLAVTGATLTPAEVDIYLNGQLVSQTSVPPGPFELSNLPATAGAGDLRVVIRDVYGREQIIANPYYYSTAVLAEGLSEYTYSIGALRNGFGASSFDYGDPAVLAYHRKGITQTLTLGGRVEAGRDLLSVGSIAGLRTRAGDIDLGLAASESGGQTGFAAQAGYQYLAKRYSFGGRARMFSDHYATTSLTAALDRPLLDASVFAAIPVPRGSLAVQYSSTDNRDGAELSRATLSLNVTLAKSVSLFTSASAVDDGVHRFGEYFAGLSFYLGGSTTASAGIRQVDDSQELSLDVQRPLPVGTGYGYRLSARSGTDQERDGASVLQYQTSFGRYEASIEPFADDRDVSLSATGGLIYQRGAFLLSRAVQESFALVRVPGVPNVRVYASNQEVGRTDRNGNLLVPNLLPYYGNPLRIHDQDIPLTYDVQEVEKVVAPPSRGGAYVEFPVAAIRTITGSVIVRGKSATRAPSFGRITLSGRGAEHESPLGREGEFYFENVANGRYGARIEFEQGSCSFELIVPSGTEPAIDLGRLACTNEALP
ncbi:MAG TPA: fimbria/pilus outer membrane usher protein [Thermoanaerobaculia bacterium]|nr:fimbria/pilus outer membrane usher protein [Thermoanaerobaculia bacterium]